MMLLRVTYAGDMISLFKGPSESADLILGKYYDRGLRTGTIVVDLGLRVKSGYGHRERYSDYDWALILAPDGTVAWVAAGRRNGSSYLERVDDV